MKKRDVILVFPHLLLIIARIVSKYVFNDDDIGALLLMLSIILQFIFSSIYLGLFFSYSSKVEKAIAICGTIPFLVVVINANLS